jgi:predicted type IV restriction endonuclease
MNGAFFGIISRSHKENATMKISKKTADRIKAELPKFQKILAGARQRKVNESNTVDIIGDMLSEVFGYAKYSEITREFAIRGTYCDLAIKLNGDGRGEKVEYLIECKSADTELKDAHLRQVVHYGADQGIEWIILTNGIEWQVHRLRHGLPISYDMVAKFNILSMSPRNERDLDTLFIVTKEGVEKKAREELCDKAKCVNRFVVAQILISEPFVSSLRRELRKIGDGISVDAAEVSRILSDVLCDDLFGCEEAKTAASIVSKHFRKSSTSKPQSAPDSGTAPASANTEPPAASDPSV